MDTVLEKQFIIVEEGYEDEAPEAKASQWLVDGDIIRPSGKLVIQEKLTPGIYKVEITREYGLYCKKMSTESDELFTFSDSVIEDLMNEINLFWEKVDLFKENNLIHKRGILLEGYPGTGKSSIISLLSDEIIKKGGIVFKVLGPQNLSLYIDFLLGSFRDIQPNTPVITILEDIERYESSDDILDFLDGKLTVNHHVVIATTNDTESIPDAFLRPSRLDLNIEVPKPSEEIRKEYFEYKKVPTEDLEKLVELTDDTTLADLKEIYTSVYLLDYSIEEAVDKIKAPRTRKNYNNARSKKSKLGV